MPNCSHGPWLTETSMPACSRYSTRANMRRCVVAKFVRTRGLCSATLGILTNPAKDQSQEWPDRHPTSPNAEANRRKTRRQRPAIVRESAVTRRFASGNCRPLRNSPKSADTDTRRPADDSESAAGHSGRGRPREHHRPENHDEFDCNSTADELAREIPPAAATWRRICCD